MLSTGWMAGASALPKNPLTLVIIQSGKVPPLPPLLMVFIEQLLSNNLVKFPMCFFFFFFDALTCGFKGLGN